MKIVKKATQHNFVIDKHAYTSEHLLEMVDEGEIVDLFQDGEYRIFDSDVKEIKIINDIDGYYKPVVEGLNGRRYYITL